jgi:hypothetical protein
MATEAPSGFTGLPGAVTIRCGRPRLSGRICQARLFEVFFFPEGPLVRPNPETVQQVGLYVSPGRFEVTDQRWKLRHRCWSGRPMVSRNYVCSVTRVARDREKGTIQLADLLPN